METTTPSPAKTAPQAGTWQQSWWIPLPRRLKRAVVWARFHSPYARWLHRVVFALYRRWLTEAELEAAARDSLTRWEADFIEHGEEEEPADFFDRQAEGFRADGDPWLALLYGRTAQLARERRLTAYKRLHAANVPRARDVSRASLPRTGSREFRPQRRASKTLARSGDPPPDDPEPSSSRSLGRSRGRLGVEATR